VFKRLQSFAFRDSPYERPNQKWVCGRLAEGFECAAGSDAAGRCRASAECRPRRDERTRRYHCARAPQHGGPCAEGPGAGGECGRPIETCQPVLGLAARRQGVVRWTVLLALAAVLLGTGGELGRRFVLSGDLTFQHGQVEGCGGCHGAGEHDALAWLAAAFTPASSQSDSKLCVKCHRLGESALNAHSLPPETLAPAGAERPPQKAERRPLLLSLAALAASPPAADALLPCGTCHKEHNGRHFDLAEIGNMRCQACHADQFASLADGHPELAGFPYRRRTRIALDHASHIGKHFGKTRDVEAPTSCTYCHEPDPAGRAMLVKPFDVSCSACHLGQIMGRSWERGAPAPRAMR
jgi:hypothetical protein